MPTRLCPESVPSIVKWSPSGLEPGLACQPPATRAQFVPSRAGAIGVWARNRRPVAGVASASLAARLKHYIVFTRIGGG
jgi:hypothetical protein